MHVPISMDKKKDEKIWILKGGIKYLIIIVKIWNWFWRTNELKEKIENIEEEIRQLDLDIEENQGKFKRETNGESII